MNLQGYFTKSAIGKGDSALRQLSSQDFKQKNSDADSAETKNE